MHISKILPCFGGENILVVAELNRYIGGCYATVMKH